MWPLWKACSAPKGVATTGWKPLVSWLACDTVTEWVREDSGLADWLPYQASSWERSPDRVSTLLYMPLSLYHPLAQNPSRDPHYFLKLLRHEACYFWTALCLQALWCTHVWPCFLPLLSVPPVRLLGARLCFFDRVRSLLVPVALLSPLLLPWPWRLTVPAFIDLPAPNPQSGAD